VGERVLALQPGVPHPIARVLEAMTDQPHGRASPKDAGLLSELVGKVPVLGLCSYVRQRVTNEPNGDRAAS
jgi:hypothetical protein